MKKNKTSKNKNGKKIEENGRLRLDFNKLSKIVELGLRVLPVAVQDWQTKDVLMQVFANARAVKLSLEKGQAVFWSTSRNQLWIKGLTSGNILKLVEIRVNCEQNSLLYLVEPLNNAGACHTREGNGYRTSCYYRKMSVDGKKLEKL